MKKTILNNVKVMAVGALGICMALSSCSKKDNGGSMDQGAKGSFEASNQTISDNSIVVHNIQMDQKGWVVVHKSNGDGGPMVPDIVSIPKQVNAGTTDSVIIKLDSTATINDGDSLWVMLHTDDGQVGTYEFDGQSGLDAPITDNGGNVVTSSIVVSAPSISVDDQPINSHTVTIAKVVAATDGWLVIHNDDGTGNITLPGIVGKTAVHAGINTDVQVKLDSDMVTYHSGQKLFAMLHIDAAPKGEYNFPGVDVPEVFGNTAGNIIVKSFTVTDVQ